MATDERPVVRVYRDPAWDTPRRTPSLAYLILTTPRTGSTWLAGLLARTGQAGVPDEYLHPGVMAAFAQQHGKQGFAPEAFFRELMPRRTTANGSFGLKLLAGQTFWQVPGADQATLMRDVMGRFDRIVHLYRRDKVAQAVSFYVAHRVKQFRVETAADQAAVRAQHAKLAFDRDALARNLSSVLAEQVLAESLLADRDHLAVAYEDLLADPAGALAPVFDYLGVTADPAALEAPTKITRDATVEAQTEQFRAWLNGAG